MLKKIGFKSTITSEPDFISKAGALIIPGVGAFDTGMKNLNEFGITEVLKYKVLEEQTPILGVCLGMQLLTKGSDEGELKGLGFIDAITRKFNFPDNSLQIPHMGWNLTKTEKDSVLFKNMFPENRFYFVHSYYVDCNVKEDILTTTKYGIQFVSSFEHKNIVGFQFHPEKSHKFGKQLLKNFIENKYAPK